MYIYNIYIYIYIYISYRYANLTKNIIVRLSRVRSPLLTSKPATMTPSTQTIISPNYHKIQECGRSKINWWAIYMQYYQDMP